MYEYMYYQCVFHFRSPKETAPSPRKLSQNWSTSLQRTGEYFAWNAAGQSTWAKMATGAAAAVARAKGLAVAKFLLGAAREARWHLEKLGSWEFLWRFPMVPWGTPKSFRMIFGFRQLSSDWGTESYGKVPYG